MTTLQAIGFTVAGGSVVLSLSLLAFGIAVRRQSPYIAPRCAARPRKVIYNPKPDSSVQDRGNALLGWIRWSMGLTYDTMLQGVPGTGTRKGGLEGSMLRCTMDGIVLIRYNEFCLRITKVATVLCLCLILPMNMTARCFAEQQDGNYEYPGCDSRADYNLTNYDRTTLANIPALEENNDTRFGVTFGALIGRMYGIAFSTWIITVYACYSLRNEWIELLAMRRAYYLEEDVWNSRKEELKETLLKDDDSVDEQAPSPLNRDKPKRKGKSSGTKKKNDHRKREPWIPHPEQRDTVPNVSLYSVLVGNLPSLPQQALMSEDVEAAVGYSKKMSIDWQLALTTTFFDQCVPNQPGFSSSVAAVTILPAATDIGRAWSRWYVAAGKLRRLRYIRKLIGELRHYDIEDHSSDEEEKVPATPKQRPFNQSDSRRYSREIYRDSIRKKKYFREVLGSTADEEVEANFLLSFDYGPEQFAVYSREFAQSAAACCPNGCGERRLRHARIDELLIMEQEAIAEVQAANEALEKAQIRVTTSKNDSDHLSPPTSPVGSPQQHFKRLNLSETLDTEAALMLKSLARVRSNGSESLGDLAENIQAQYQAQMSLPEEPRPFNIDSGADIRRRTTSSQSSQWSRVESLVNEAHNMDGSLLTVQNPPDTGAWKMPKLAGIKKMFDDWRKTAANTTDRVVDTLARQSSYAVVTFTSRQAAVAARHCLADGRGVGRWIAADNIPVPPLADAAPFSICPCRGCCRPVTLNINDRQKTARRLLTFSLLVAIYVFYTIPLTLATGLVDPQKWAEIFGREWTPSPFYSKYLSGILPALLWTGFFALCPLLFKSLANFGSNALSVLSAEHTALQYYWWFMIITAFSGNSLSTMFLDGFSTSQGITIGSEAQEVLASIASAIPTKISPQWLNWIIVRTTMTLPLQYLLQINTVVFSFLGWHCCSRMVRGGGPGGPVPYRVFIDTGVVLLCVVALAPASPLVAPVALVHFLFSEPILRRNIIFMYRPKFDGGGILWPFLFEMIISSLLFGHVLMVTMLALKKAVGPAIVAAIPFIPTLVFRHELIRLYLKPYKDAGLVQMSMLDGWDNQEPTSQKKREDFRRFLVDAHKASYVPVCIAGSKEVMTSEPAVVIHSDNDEGDPSMFLPRSAQDTPQRELSSTRSHSSQFGVAMRRVTPRSLERSQATRHFDFSGNGSRNFSFNEGEHSIAEEQNQPVVLQDFDVKKV